MSSKIGAGIVAGIVAGLAVGLFIQRAQAPIPGGDQVPMMVMVASIAGSDRLIVGWLIHLVSAAALGGLFGSLFGRQVHHFGSGVGWGAVFGLIVWVVAGLVVLPLLLASRIFAPLTVPEMRPLASATFVGHFVFGLLVGGLFAGLNHEKVYVVHHHPMHRAA